MKKVLILGLFIIVMLVACKPKIHDDVNDGVAEDSIQVMDAIMDNIEEGTPIEKVSDEDDTLFERYYSKYIDEDSDYYEELEGIDDNIKIMAAGSLVGYSKGSLLESDKKDVQESYDLMIEYIEDGEGHFDDQ